MVNQTTTAPAVRAKLILVGGLARNGKSTLCHLLQQHASVDGWHCQRFSFADPLKSIVRMVQQNYVDKDTTALQATSDQWKLQYGHACFAKDLVARVQAYHETVPPFIDKLLYLVDDVRYIHEVNACDNWGAVGRDVVKVRVVRPGFEEYDRDMAHSSETELLDVQWDNFRVEASDMDTLVADAMSLWQLIKS